MHVDVIAAIGLAVLAPVALLVVVRRRRPQGEAGTDPVPDKTVLHCAAPPPAARPRRS